MLSDFPSHATLPTADVDRLRRFYEDILGLEVQRETTAGIFYRTGDGTRLAVTRQSGRPSGTHTQVGFEVRDLAGLVTELRGRGVSFEEYETPKTVDGIADVPVGRAAWFKDPDGNLFGLLEFGE